MSTATLPRPAGGLVDWVSATDHKRVAVRMMVLCAVFFFLGGTLALTMRSELARPGLQYVSTSTYDQLFTMHGSTMIFLVMTPLAVALGAYLVPLQIGAADLVAPRLNLFSVWLLGAGGLIMYSGFLTAHGAAQAGWTEFLPVSGRVYAPGPGTDLWAIGVFLATVAVIILAADISLTVFLRRAPGMTMRRLPIFTWAMLATCFLIVFGFPVLPAVLVILEIQRHTSLTFSPTIYLELFWFYGHPAVYVMFFPFLGAVFEVLQVFSGRRVVGYTPLVVTLLAFNATSMTVWAHHMFTTGHVFNEYFALTSTLLLVFAGVEYFDAVATMWGGAIRLEPPMLFALAFLLQFVIGGVTGIVLASPPLDYHLNDSYFVVAHFHYTLFAGSLFGGLAGLYYWYPKITGHMLNRRLSAHPVLDPGGGHQPHVLPPVHPGLPRDGPARGRLSRPRGAHRPERALDRRGVHHRARHARPALEPHPGAAPGHRRGPRPVAGPDARVVDELAPAAPQLHVAPGDRIGGAAP